MEGAARGGHPCNLPFTCPDVSPSSRLSITLIFRIWSVVESCARLCYDQREERLGFWRGKCFIPEDDFSPFIFVRHSSTAAQQLILCSVEAGGYHEDLHCCLVCRAPQST